MEFFRQLIDRLGPAPVLAFLVLSVACGDQPQPTSMAAQYPSPMADNTRVHERIEELSIAGSAFVVDGVLPKPVHVFVPEVVGDSVDLLLHLHGAAYLSNQAVTRLQYPTVAATVNLGSGSSAYEGPFIGRDVLRTIVSAISDSLMHRTKQETVVRRLTVSAFSAGYGGVRALLRDSESVKRIDAVLLLDGLHASYVPDGVTIAQGGRVDSVQMAPFVDFAALAVRGSKALYMTHSEIFPGTYASTTETSDYLLAQLGIARTPVLEWGPLGMQQLSNAEKGRLTVEGYAGNSAPDHVDHLHAIGWRLEKLIPGTDN